MMVIEVVLPNHTFDVTMKFPLFTPVSLWNYYFFGIDRYGREASSLKWKSWHILSTVYNKKRRIKQTIFSSINISIIVFTTDFITGIIVKLSIIDNQLEEVSVL